MKADNKKQIWAVYELLCARDPSWAHPEMLPKFKILYGGWRTVELRNKVHSHIFYTLSWERGWMPEADFERFKKYAMQ